MAKTANDWFNANERPVAARLRKQRNLMAAIDKIGRYMKPESAYAGVKQDIALARKLNQISATQAADLKAYIKEYVKWSTK